AAHSAKTPPIPTVPAKQCKELALDRAQSTAKTQQINPSQTQTTTPSKLRSGTNSMAHSYFSATPTLSRSIKVQTLANSSIQLTQGKAAPSPHGTSGTTSSPATPSPCLSPQSSG